MGDKEHAELTRREGLAVIQIILLKVRKWVKEALSSTRRNMQHRIQAKKRSKGYLNVPNLFLETTAEGAEVFKRQRLAKYDDINQAISSGHHIETMCKQTHVASSPKRCLNTGTSSSFNDRSWRPAGVRIRIISMIYDTQSNSFGNQQHLPHGSKCSPRTCLNSRWSRRPLPSVSNILKASSNWRSGTTRSQSHEPRAQTPITRV